MQYRKLGHTDIDVSTIALGCWAIVGDFTWGEQDEADAMAAIDRAFELGINFFDTAPGYGDGASEQMLGRALAGRRGEAVIATKVPPNKLEPDALAASCEQSLRELGTDYIDLLMIHWPNWDIPIDRTWGAMQKLQSQGKVRVLGVSNFGPRDLDDLSQFDTPAANQLGYSLLARAVEYETLPRCAERGIGVTCYSPLAQGLLTGKFASADEVPETRARTRHFADSRPHTKHGEPGCEALTFETIERIRSIAGQAGVTMTDLSLAWLLTRPAVVSVLAGARSPQQVETNIAAANITLDQSTLTALDDATRPLKESLGPNPDLWFSGDRVRIR